MTKKIATVKMVLMGPYKQVIHLLCSGYAILLFVRIALSYFPQLRYQTFAKLIFFCTDPYLKFFRRFIPPIGGVLDMSPMLGFFALRLLENLLLKFV